RPPLRGGRAAAAAAAGRLDLRPCDDGPRGGARRAREDRLARPPAQGGRPGRLYLFLSVWALPRVPREPAGRVPGQDRAPARALAVPAFPWRLRRVLLPAAARGDLPRAGFASRRAGGTRELRPLAGHLRSRPGGPPLRRQ